MEPVSLGMTAVVLLASKFGGGFAEGVGSSSWHAVLRLREVIAEKFGRGSQISTEVMALNESSTAQAREAVAGSIAKAAGSDPNFADEVQRLVATARRDATIESFVANAYDNAKQLNIRGDNTGTINF
jgi:hypothetical protein